MKISRNLKIITRSYSKNLVTEGRRRVVVTGLGIVSSVGITVDSAWKFILNGKSATKNLPNNDDYTNLPCKVASPLSEEHLNEIMSNFSKTEIKKMSPATIYALFATKQAFESSQWKPHNDIEQQRTGVAVGMGMVDLKDVCDTNESLKRAYNKISPFFVPRILLNMAAGQISIAYKLQGPNHAVSTACATGLHAIGDAYRFIKYNDADAMVCGATEACISPLSIAGFCRLRALSTSFNANPFEASRPFDKNRDGFVMGEGSAIFILEELSHAKKRNAKIFGEILGYGLSGDASHLTAPSESGLGARLAMQRALIDANLKAADIDYVNAHATSTPLGDSIEARAIQKIFGQNEFLAISSTKGSHGHLLGAAGALESIFTILSCRDGIFPPTINLGEVEEEFINVNFVKNSSQKWQKEGKRIAIKNSFGFGGTNVSIIFSNFEE